MCGIFGAIDSSLSPAQALDVLGTLRHRGPDGVGGRWDSTGRVFFGHTRLSIIDLSPSGAQPMVNEDETVMLTMNGEIYNHADLRRRLERSGHTFKGRCDAEVILHLYEEMGIDLVGELHGMFAFALYDSKTEILHLARDRLGIKPLYYYEHGRQFYFASELKALRAVPGIDLSPDVTAYYDFLTYQFVPAPKTIYKHGRKLPPAHYLARGGGHTRIRSYWDLDFERAPAVEADTACEELDSLLQTVVRDHLLADVPVGVLLSSGTDSSLVMAAAAPLASRPLETFTIGFPDRRDDEAAAAEEIATRLGGRPSLQRFSLHELLASVSRLPALFDEPFADHSALPMIGLSQLAAAHVKVVLSGDGGDETHVGYGRYLKRGRRRLAHAILDAIPGFDRFVGLAPLRRQAWLRNGAGGDLGRSCHFHGGIPRATKHMFIDIAAPELRDYDDYWLLRHYDRPDLPILGRQQYVDLKTYLPEGILTKVDRTSMHFGLEVRPPLLDHRLVEFAARVPANLAYRDGTQKYLLRRLLARHLPADLVYGRKRAFSVPIRHFIENEGLFRLDADIDVFGAFRIRRDKVNAVLHPAHDSQGLWMLYVLADFLRQQGEETGVRRQENTLHSDS